MKTGHSSNPIWLTNVDVKSINNYGSSRCKTFFFLFLQSINLKQFEMILWQVFGNEQYCLLIILYVIAVILNCGQFVL